MSTWMSQDVINGSASEGQNGLLMVSHQCRLPSFTATIDITLPAYTQEGILLSRVYRGSTDLELFENFLE